MKLTKRELVFMYLYNLSCKCDNDYDQLVLNNRSRKSDELDYLELILAKNKKDTVNSILVDITKILGL